MYTDISMEWKQQCQHIKQISQPIDFKSFGVDQMSRKLPMEFKVVQYMTQTEKHLKKLYANPDHFSFNRNSSIMTFDQNRVLLSDESSKNSTENYINANYIDVCGHKVIATQGPLHSTFTNFWKMIDLHNVKAIFMLCMTVQKQKVKCDLYWPAKLGTETHAGDYLIKFVSRQECGKFLRHRKFLVLNKANNQQKEVDHYQFIGWPDGDQPLEAAQKPLKKMLGVMIDLIEKDENVVVHCSAGVGRTGTLIAMAEIKMLIPKSESISIFELVRRLREQRWAMVYTANQYEYLYKFAEAESLAFFQPNQKAEESPDENEEHLGDSAECEEMAEV